MNVRINLLPHREMRRERRKKDFVVLAALVENVDAVARRPVDLPAGQDASAARYTPSVRRNWSVSTVASPNTSALDQLSEMVP